MINNKGLLKQFKNHYGISKSTCKNQWKHINECGSFYSGDYMAYRDEIASGRGASRRIKEVQFNRVKPYVNSIVGFMAQMRRKPDYQAVIEQSEDQRALSEYLNGYSDHIRDNSNSDQMETRQDKDLVIGGVGVTDTAVTLKAGHPTRNPHGEVIVERVDPNQVGWDGNAEHPNLLDSGWCYRAKDYDLDDAMTLLDANEDDFESVNPDDDIRDYDFNPHGGIQDKIGYEWADSKRQMVRVYFYQWFDIEVFYRIENPLLEVENPELAQELIMALEDVEVNTEDGMFAFDPTAEMLVITKDKRKQIKDIFALFGVPFKPLAEKRKVYYTAVLSGEKIFSKYKSVAQDGFSLKFKTGDYDTVNKIWTGIVASMREPQRYYNKSLTELMLIIASNSRGGVLYEEDAVDNVAQFEAQWAKTNGAVKVNSGALSAGKIQPKAIPAMQTGYEGVLETSSMALGQVTGIDESFFGAIAGGNETAMLQRQRIKQATTTLACYFDACILYSKEQGQMMLSYMRILADSSRGRLFPTYDPDGNLVYEKVSPDFFAEEYDIRVSEAPETPMQKEYYTQTLIQMGQTMMTIGDPRYLQMYAAAVKYMPIPDRDKNDILKVSTGEQQIDPAMVKQLQAQIQELQGEQSQAMMAKMMADIEKTNADTQAKLVDARKTAAEIDGVHEDTEKKAIENDIIAAKDYEEVNVNI